MAGGKFMFTKGSSKSTPPSEEISGYFGKEAVFEGKMAFEGVFRLDGKFEGEIFQSGTLIVGDSAVVKGKMEVTSIVINGRVEGDVYAKERTEIHTTGKFYGNLLTPVLTIDEGGIFEGHCKMERIPEKEKEFHPPPNNGEHPLSV